MKNLFFITLIICLASCKKESVSPSKIEDVQYPYTKLAGHTWEGLSYTDSITATPFYQFLHITSDTTVGIYTASYDGTYIVIPEIKYPCKIITHTNHDDTLQIFYLGFDKPIELYTTKDTTKISDGYIDYIRFK
jgi:hypothetical protein